jgi:hypothetical protein
MHYLQDKSKGRSKSPGKFVKVCWRCGKEGHYKKQCRSKSVERGKGYEDAPSTEEPPLLYLLDYDPSWTWEISHLDLHA